MSFLCSAPSLPIRCGKHDKLHRSPRACAASSADRPPFMSFLPVLWATPVPTEVPPALAPAVPAPRTLVPPCLCIRVPSGHSDFHRGPRLGAVHPWSSVLRAHLWQLKPEVCTQRCHLWRVLLQGPHMQMPEPDPRYSAFYRTSLEHVC